MQPPLGTSKVQYEHKRRLAQCLPALLRAEGIHSAFYTTSNVGVQRALGFAEVWSSVEDYDSLHAKPGQPTAARKRAKKRLRWPRHWWKSTTAALLDGRSNGQYNWLGDHDYFGLPKARGTLRPPAPTCPACPACPTLRRCAVHRASAAPPGRGLGVAGA